MPPGAAAVREEVLVLLRSPLVLLLLLVLVLLLAASPGGVSKALHGLPSPPPGSRAAPAEQSAGESSPALAQASPESVERGQGGERQLSLGCACPIVTPCCVTQGCGDPPPRSPPTFRPTRGRAAPPGHLRLLRWLCRLRVSTQPPSAATGKRSHHPLNYHFSQHFSHCQITL